MNPLAFPPRGSSLSPPRVLRSQNPTPPASSNTFAPPVYQPTSSPVRRKPLPPTAFTSPLLESPIDAGILQTLSRKRAETHPARKEDESPESVVRNLDKYVLALASIAELCPISAPVLQKLTDRTASLDSLGVTPNLSSKTGHILRNPQIL